MHPSCPAPKTERHGGREAHEAVVGAPAFDHGQRRQLCLALHHIQDLPRDLPRVLQLRDAAMNVADSVGFSGDVTSNKCVEGAPATAPAPNSAAATNETSEPEPAQSPTAQ